MASAAVCWVMRLLLPGGHLLIQHGSICGTQKVIYDMQIKLMVDHSAQPSTHKMFGTVLASYFANSGSQAALSWSAIQ
jgi:hypothetical protein